MLGAVASLRKELREDRAEDRATLETVRKLLAGRAGNVPASAPCNVTVSTAGDPVETVKSPRRELVFARCASSLPEQVAPGLVAFEEVLAGGVGKMSISSEEAAPTTPGTTAPERTLQEPFARALEPPSSPDDVTIDTKVKLDPPGWVEAQPHTCTLLSSESPLGWTPSPRVAL